MSIGIDAPRVTDGDEALVLMFHHLKLAAMYFEATPTEITVQEGEFSRLAMIAWLDAMEGLYPDE